MYALGVELPVPRLEHCAGVVLLKGLLQLDGLLGGVHDRRPCDAVEDRVHRLGGLRAAVAGDELRVVGETEQRRSLGTETRQLDDQGSGVVLADQAAADGGAMEPTPYVAVLQLVEQWLAGGVDDL